MGTIAIVGGGFAGLAAAAGAARQRDTLGLNSSDIHIILINPDPFTCIRVRNYELDLTGARVLLDDVLEPVSVERIEGSASGLDVASRQLKIKVAGREQILTYNRLLLTAGSQLHQPDIPGLSEFSFNVDTYEAALRLNQHIDRLPLGPANPGQYTVLVLGAGLTGIETACEMPAKLRAAVARSGAAGSPRLRTILADHAPHLGSNMGDSARPLIERALDALAIEARVGIEVQSVDEHGVVLKGGERIHADTVVWTGGMRANPLTEQFSVQRDCLGRLPVDEYLRVTGVDGVFAAGDVATLSIDGVHASVMSCQHARPMGRFAGHNVVCDLVAKPMLPLRVDWYITCLDLGSWGAVYTSGWDRQVSMTGMAAKAIKQNINCVRIYPPRSRDPREILEWAAPVIQSAPSGHG